MSVAKLLEAVKGWAAGDPGVIAVALVGSHARGTARPDSDVDLIVICADPQSLLGGDWYGKFGRIRSAGIEDYGALRSLRVRYESGPEVEFGLTTRDWARLPLDAGTAQVLAGGMRILYDRENLLRGAAVPGA